MRYRKLDANGDMIFGHGAADFWHNTPEGVGQSVLTRLLLFAGEWYLDTGAGTPWGGFPLNDLVVQQGRILGVHTQLTRDAALRERILLTTGVIALNNYASQFDPNSRSFAVEATIDTIYGASVNIAVSQAAGAQQPTTNIVVVPRAVMPQRQPSPPLLRRLPSPR